jgi:uncharacterized protein (TIGR02246 family)
MKTFLAVALTGLSLQSVCLAEAQPPQQSRASRPHQRSQSAAHQRAAVKAVLKRYEHALNASDVNGVVQLYTDDAVVLAPNAPSAVGIDAVRATYTGIFQAIDIELTFDVAEVNVVSSDWAFLRSTSHGTVTTLADGATLPGKSQELFVLHKVEGHWKLARYSFSSTLPTA